MGEKIFDSMTSPERGNVDGFFRSARLKNEMRARFHVEFSETALGHVSLGNSREKDVQIG